MATAVKQKVTLPITHFEGCPVSLNPDDERLAARVETHRTLKDGLRLNEESDRETAAPTTWITVVHCCECGAVAYHKE